MVTVLIAVSGLASAYTITVDPLPTLTFPKKAAGGPACTPPCPPKPVAR